MNLSIEDRDKLRNILISDPKLGIEMCKGYNLSNSEIGSLVINYWGAFKEENNLINCYILYIANLSIRMIFIKHPHSDNIDVEVTFYHKNIISCFNTMEIDFDRCITENYLYEECFKLLNDE